MAKETHSIRVWALRDNQRKLVLSLNSPSARDEGLARVEELKREAAVDGIEMEEYLVLNEDTNGKLPARRGTMRWARATHGWRRLSDSPSAR